jgi:hypothetical protein
VILIANLVSKSLPHVFLLLVQEQDTVPDPFHVISFLNVERHHRAELHSADNPIATVPFEVPV